MIQNFVWIHPLILFLFSIGMKHMLATSSPSTLIITRITVFLGNHQCLLPLRLNFSFQLSFLKTKKSLIMCPRLTITNANNRLSIKVLRGGFYTYIASKDIPLRSFLKSTFLFLIILWKHLANITIYPQTLYPLCHLNF